MKADIREVSANLKKMSDAMEKHRKDILMELADTLLLMSRKMVPHDMGDLEKSGQVGYENNKSIVFYNKRYAAFQHEGVRADGTHRVRNWQSGRSKKFLEYPVRRNFRKWVVIAGEEYAKRMKKI